MSAFCIKNVLSAFCIKNGAVTKTGDFGKTFSWMENSAVLQGLGTKNHKLIGCNKLMFLTTSTGTWTSLVSRCELLPPVAQEDVVVGALADEGLVVAEAPAGRPQAQVRVVVLARPVSCPSARESSAYPGPRRKFSTTAPSAPVQARAPPSAASMICCRCLAQLAILFLRAQFFCGRAGVCADWSLFRTVFVAQFLFSPTICAQME